MVLAVIEETTLTHGITVTKKGSTKYIDSCTRQKLLRKGRLAPMRTRWPWSDSTNHSLSVQSHSGEKEERVIWDQMASQKNYNPAPRDKKGPKRHQKEEKTQTKTHPKSPTKKRRARRPAPRDKKGHEKHSIKRDYENQHERPKSPKKKGSTTPRTQSHQGTHKTPQRRENTNRNTTKKATLKILNPKT